MKKNLVTMMVTIVMVAGALVGCGSKEVAQETTPVVEATVEASVEEDVVEEATEEVSVEEEVVEEVPQTKQMKVLTGWIRLGSDGLHDVYSYQYDEYGNPVKVVWNDLSNADMLAELTAEDSSADTFLTFGDKYIVEYADVVKSENGKVLECNWNSADGTPTGITAVYTYNKFGSELTKDEDGNHTEYTYDENGYRTSEYTTYADGRINDDKANNIVSDVDEDGTMTHVKYSSGSETYLYYTTIEVLVEE